MHAVTGSKTSSLGAPCLLRSSHQVVPSLRLFQRGCCRHHLGDTRIHAKLSAEQDFNLVDLLKTSLKTPSKSSSASDASTSSPLEASSSQGAQTASKQVEQAASQGASSIGQQTEQAAAAPKQALQSTAQNAQSAAQSPLPDATNSALPDAASTASQLPDVGTDAAASSASDAVTQAVQSSPDGNSVNDATQGALSAASEATASASKALSEASEGLSKGLSEATEGLSKGLSDVTEGLGQGISGVAEDLNKGLSGMSGVAEDLKKGLSEISGGAAEVLDGAREAVSGAAAVAGDQVSGVASTVSSQVGSAASGALDTLPPNVREALLAATTPVVQALADPQVGLPAAGLAVGVSATLWWRERFGGYAGIISADRAADLLEYENSLLVDVRSEDSRLSSGTLDLRYGSRTKGVVIPLGAVSRRSGTQLINAGVVPFQLTALLIGGLNKVDRSTRIIILDDFEKRGIKLARAVSSETGLRAFVLQGGIKGWAAAGLGIKGSIDYDASPLDGITDQVQGRILPTLRNPVIGTAAITGAILAGAAIYDVHRTLQFVGSLGVLLTIGTIPLRYERSEDAYNDLIRPVVRVVGKVTNTVSSIGPPPQPATPVSAELLDDNEEPEYSREEDSLQAEEEADQQPEVQAPSAESTEEKAKEPANSNA